MLFASFQQSAALKMTLFVVLVFGTVYMPFSFSEVMFDMFRNWKPTKSSSAIFLLFFSLVLFRAM